MGLVLPFMQFLDLMQFGEYTRSRELIFWHKNDLISEKVLGQRLQTLSYQILGQRIVIRYWWHIMQGFIRYYMNWDLQNPWSRNESKLFIFYLLFYALLYLYLCIIIFIFMHYYIHILCIILFIFYALFYLLFYSYLSHIYLTFTSLSPHILFTFYSYFTIQLVG